jgi:hypothetical protein
MTIDMFPLNEIPFDAYSKLLTTHKSYLKPFVPTNMNDDLRTGQANAMVYWYPVYIVNLYSLALQDEHYQPYLESFNPKNYWLFVDIFADTAKKLDKLLYTKLNNNYLDETRITKKRLK